MRGLIIPASYRVLSASAVLVIVGLSFAEDSFPESDAVTIRAKGPLSSTTIATLAQVAEPTILDRANYPDVPNFSARDVARVLCGSFRQAYWDETVKANPGLQISPDTPLGEQSYKIKWPACAYVVEKANRFHYIVKRGDKASNIFAQLTGTVGSKLEVDNFFKNSAVENVASIKPGEVLTYSTATRDTPVRFANGANLEFLKDAFIKIQPSAAYPDGSDTSGGKFWFGGVSSGPSPQLADKSGRKLTIAAGKISSVATDDYLPPEECKNPGEDASQNEGSRIENAYKYSLKKIWDLGLDQYPALVAIVDNGFFGAHLDNGKLVFGTPFPARFFGTPALFGDGEIGFTINDGTSIIYPLNSQNNLPASAPTVVSGHGTHISGLVLGGPEFESHTDIFDRDKDKPWLHLLIINVGRGSDTLTSNSETELFRRVRLLENRIVNLSLEYQDTSDGSVQSTFEDLVTDSHSRTNLFVVAAGNDANVDVGAAHFYPAALGGAKSSNVLSVAAYRSDGSLANFSNRGRNVIDIAAPGCNVRSWIGEADKPMPVSGTSQAAAKATFAAALLRSLGNPTAADIKARLFVSGDLLSAGKFYGKVENQGDLNPDPAQVMSRSRLNVSKAMFLFDDYVRYRKDGDSVDSVVVGKVTQLPDFICDGDRSAATDWHDVWAYKSEIQNTAGWLYMGRLGSTVNAPCHASVSSAHSLFVTVDATIDRGGNIIPTPKNPTVEVPAGNVREYIAMRMLNSHQ